MDRGAEPESARGRARGVRILRHASTVVSTRSRASLEFYRHTVVTVRERYHLTPGRIECGELYRSRSDDARGSRHDRATGEELSLIKASATKHCRHQRPSRAHSIAQSLPSARPSD